jgi:hypothetical protein
MNFQDLLEKMKALDEAPTPVSTDGAGAGDECATASTSVKDVPLMGEEEVEECGEMPAMSPQAPKQADNVSMNVSMNGQGAGGIKDLIDILRNIESKDSVSKDADDMLVGMEEESIEAGFGSTDTKPEPHTSPVSSVLKKGQDIHSNQGDHRLRQTGLPRAQMEGLVSHLSNLYQEIKERQ